jgi:hypothetical protein
VAKSIDLVVNEEVTRLPKTRLDVALSGLFFHESVEGRVTLAIVTLGLRRARHGVARSDPALHFGRFAAKGIGLRDECHGDGDGE